MKLRDYLTGPERQELRNVMTNWPVFAGDTISHATAKSLNLKGLIYRDKNGEWRPNWDGIKNWNTQRNA